MPGRPVPLLWGVGTTISWQGVAQEPADKHDALQGLKAGPEGGLWYVTRPSLMC